jgi:predicted RNA binding protein YcfA (HicA-like mRNA interferase family)
MMLARLPSCTAHDVDRVLTREGFLATHQRGSRRYYKSPITGKIVTSVPMHPGDLNRSLLKIVFELPMRAMSCTL